ncbi:hypothetical protein [Nocardia sp. NPDC056000]|uniref:hypothetical protein n=1 Tax=Nocardia sp. NPDC056000 TaxID=3345674 RepID=UPI0035D938D2
MTGIDDCREVLLFCCRTGSGRPIIVTLRPDDEDDDTAIVDYLIRSVYDMRTYELGLFTEWENNR